MHSMDEHSSPSQDHLQIELLRELMKLQKDMIIMLLSMLEGKRCTLCLFSSPFFPVV